MLMRSFIKDMLVLALTFKVVQLGISGIVPVSVVLLSLAVFLISAWFRLEKWGIL